MCTTWLAAKGIPVERLSAIGVDNFYSPSGGAGVVSVSVCLRTHQTFGSLVQLNPDHLPPRHRHPAFTFSLSTRVPCQSATVDTYSQVTMNSLGFDPSSVRPNPVGPGTLEFSSSTSLCNISVFLRSMLHRW